MELLIEIAVTDFITAQSAVKGGADRIELCCGLSEGGLTPSFGLIKQCREKLNTQLFPILRPRSGDFLYTDDEFELLLHDLALCKEIGCDGIVAGFLTREGAVDLKRTAAVINRAYPMEVTFHRAFDRCRDPFEALEQLAALGCSRILTSGQQLKAIQALDLLQQLVQVADNRIIIMPGSGVTPQNINEIKAKTGANEFHASLRTTHPSDMHFRNPVFEPEQDYLNPAIQESTVQQLKAALT